MAAETYHEEYMDYAESAAAAAPPESVWGENPLLPRGVDVERYHAVGGWRVRILLGGVETTLTEADAEMLVEVLKKELSL